MPKTVPNQRTLLIHKEPTDKYNLYTVNNLEALDEASRRLQSIGGFKLYMYLAKNQDKYEFALSSSHFCMWSGLGLTAYKTAFKELVEQGYLIPSKTVKDYYIFYDKAQIPEENLDIIIKIPEEKVEEIKEIKEKKFKF